VSEPFDPYDTWLAIPPDEQPPSCYRLLGIRLWEDRTEVIEHAADQRMAHLKSLAPGTHAGLAQKLLNEVAAARIRLLDPHKKAMYDQRLRKELEARSAAVAVGQASQPPDPLADKQPVPPYVAKPVPPAADARTATWASLGQLGEYRLLEKLGEGGMGAVYKAMHTRLGRVVALKVLRKDHLRDKHAVARFDREMKAVGAVDHPNIVRAMDAREIEGTRLLVMEFVEGVDLNALGRHCHPLAVADACEIIRQAALGLEHVHRHGLIHRDVKPSNLMVTPQGVVKLLDLGLARFQFDPEAGDEVTGTGTAMGTVDYMAPEQISDSRSVDIRADVYSLGCTLYKLLAGCTPFSGPSYKTAGEKMAAHLRDPVPPLRRLRGDVPAELARLVERMLAKEPAKRPSRPVEVADAIGALAAASNLAALVARSRGEPAPEPEQSLVPTQDLASCSSATQFLRQIVGPAEATAVVRSAGKPGSRKLPRGLAAGLAAGAVLLAAVVLWAMFALRRGPREAVLVFDWPEAERAGAELMIDDAAVALPASGPAEVRYAAGEHRVRATRPGYRVPEQTIRVEAGQERKVVLRWQPTPNLVLEWAQAERAGAILEIDGAIQEIEPLALKSSAGRLHLRLSPGPHVVRLSRLGYDAIEERVEIVDGKEHLLRPKWREVGLASLPAGTLAGKQPVPPGGKPPAAEPAAKETAKESPSPLPSPKGRGEEDAAEKRRKALAARWAEQAGEAEKQIAAWHFIGAGKALEKLRFEEAELTARLSARRDEVARMAALKARIIERINAAEPKLKKSDLMLRGMGGEVVKADEEGITAQLISGAAERLAWSELGEKAVPKLLERAIDPDTPDDWLAAGLIAMASSVPVLAESHLEKARELGTNVDPYLVPLAEAMLGRVRDLIDKGSFSAAQRAITSLETKYSGIPWYAANKPSIDGAREAAKRGIAEKEAEDLYKEAAGLFTRKELFDLKPIIDKLKADYADTAALTDGDRKPALVEMEKAVANLGKYLTVRQDGKGDFANIQKAIDAAPVNSLIEIQDNGPYNEKLLLGKEGLVVRGGSRCWPTITSGGRLTHFPILVQVDAPRVTLEKLVLTHVGAAGASPVCIAGQLVLRSSIVYSPVSSPLSGGAVRLEDCFFAGAKLGGPIVAKNTFFLAALSGISGSKLENCIIHGTEPLGSSCEMRRCTIRSLLVVDETYVLVDCILTSVQSASANVRIEHCNVFGSPPFIDQAKGGKGCFLGDPQFADPKNFDYRLRPTSPCRGRASDGGDVGFRYTPEIVEVLKAAFELRKRGLIKF